MLLTQAEELQALEAEAAELQAQPAAKPHSELCAPSAMPSAVAGVKLEGQQPSMPGAEPSAAQHAAASTAVIEEQCSHAKPQAAAHDAQDAAVRLGGKATSKHAGPAAACQAAEALTGEMPDELELDSSPPQSMQGHPTAEQPGASTPNTHAEQAQEEQGQHAGAECQAKGSSAHGASESMELPAEKARPAAAASMHSAMHQTEVQGGSGTQHSAAASQPQDLFASFAAFQDLLEPEVGCSDGKKRKREGDVVSP